MYRCGKGYDICSRLQYWKLIGAWPFISCALLVIKYLHPFPVMELSDYNKPASSEIRQVFTQFPPPQGCRGPSSSLANYDGKIVFTCGFLYMGQEPVSSDKG